MSVNFKIEGTNSNAMGGDLSEAHVHPFSTAGGVSHTGLVVLTEPFTRTEPSTKFFLNDAFGASMNQNVSFTDTPELIIDGGSGGTEWTGSINAGTWNFADAGKVTITSANNDDSATWDDAGTIDMSTHSAITGLVDLDTYNSANNSILMRFGLAGTPLGNSVNLNDYINAADFAEQAFVIPKADLGIAALTVDEMTLTIVRSGGGPKPTVKFDDIQIEKTGDPLVFSLDLDVNEKFHISELTFAYADAFAGTLVVDESTNTAAPKATMPALAHDKILGLSALTNGFTIIRSKKGKTLFSANIKTIGAHISAGAEIGNILSDGTNTFFTLKAIFPEPLVIEGTPDDSLTVTINDDMSGLLQFTASARGALETKGI